MENNNYQGNCQQEEQQWVCPDCETVNTGKNCTVCGCPRPAEKQEPEIPQMSGEQGSYEDALREWTCPACETRNVGKICTVCGYSRPEKKKPISKKILAAAAAAAVIVIAVLAGIAVRPRDHFYRDGCALLESGQYEQALELFRQIPDESPEKERLAEECISQAEKLNDSGDYSVSLEILNALPDSKAVSLLKAEVCYNYGLSLFKQDQNYQESYLQFKAAGDYKDASMYLDQVVSAWFEDIIDRPVVESARFFKETVKLTDEQGSRLYHLLCSKNIYTYEPPRPDGAVGWSLNEHDFEVRGILLEMLPANEYENMAELKTLFSLFDEDHPDIFVRDHRDILDKLWDAPVVRNIVENFYCFDKWLLGTWTTEDKQYSLEFVRDESDPDAIVSTTTLPWVDQPEGTAHWNIKNMTYVWTDEDDNNLAEVYRFKLLEPDKIEVYAFKDQKTYTMIRK